MATLRTYRCTKCDYRIEAAEEGYSALMHGTSYYFNCSNCKDIVFLNLRGKYYPECPECGRMDTLRSWNPVEGHCPKCGADMKEDESAGIIMAD